MNPPSSPLRDRILLLLPTARDGELTADILGRSRIATRVCEDRIDFAAQLALGAGAVMVGEEMLGPAGAHEVLAHALKAQPRWSDLPVLLLTRSGADSNAVNTAIASLGNVTLLERPLRVATLVSSVHAALRARARQYQIESHLLALERARAAKAEESQRKDEFLAMLAHELRNPLAPVRNALHVLEMDDSDPARRSAMRQMMLRQVNHMVRMVDDLVEASRLSQGKIALRREPLDLRDALADAIALARPQVLSGAQTLQTRLGDEPLPLEADPVRLAQVFGNLINNAAKYGRPGGTIVVEARRERGTVVVSVRDDGVGIEPELLPRVFELFTQGTRDAHRLHDGLGIGLALVRTLVEMHGGTVAARSDGKGRGAEFEVRLPMSQAPRVAEAPAQPAEALPADLRVLVVDDNVDAARSLGMVLELLGVAHRIAHDGAEALGVAADFEPHAVLLDIGMPGMDGYELARRLRANPLHAATLLVALTGWSEPSDRERGRRAGIDHHVGKPADVDALLALLRSAPVAAWTGAPDADQANGSRSTMLASRSGPVDTIASGQPASSSSARR